jgi:hypothetical protein
VCVCVCGVCSVILLLTVPLQSLIDPQADPAPHLSQPTFPATPLTPPTNASHLLTCSIAHSLARLQPVRLEGLGVTPREIEFFWKWTDFSDYLQFVAQFTVCSISSFAYLCSWPC